MTFVDIIKKLYCLSLDLAFPRTVTVRKFENMSPEKISLEIPGAEVSELDNIFAAVNYKDDLARALIWELKYRGNKKAAQIIAHLMYEIIISELSEPHTISHFDNPLLIPIPLSKGRLRERGFNQMELVAKEICKLDEAKQFEYAPDILRKIKNTSAQTKTNSKKERLNNLKGCFEVRDAAREYARGRNVILIDDVYTTGSTLSEARRTLKRAGVKKVIAFTGAH